jgi:hypothetical protein
MLYVDTTHCTWIPHTTPMRYGDFWYCHLFIYFLIWYSLYPNNRSELLVMLFYNRIIDDFIYICDIGWQITELCWTLSIVRSKLNIHQRRYSAVSIVTGYGLDVQVVRVRVPVRASFFSSPHHPHGFWAPPNLLSNGYWGLFPRGKAARAWSWLLNSN